MRVRLAKAEEGKAWHAVMMLLRQLQPDRGSEAVVVANVLLW
jgi:hypothetical protein